MKNPPRFLAPLSISRPRGVRVVEAFSPKLGRRLQCFGQQACDQWILLETDPSVLTFCERPAQVATTTGKHLVDYWVQDQREERFLCVGNPVTLQSVIVDSTAIPVHHVLSIELAAAHVWIKNWERMLPVVICCWQLIPPSFSAAILKFITEPMQLSRIEREFGFGDPTLVRAAVFSLVHRGHLQAPQLKTEPLSLLTAFQPAKAIP